MTGRGQPDQLAGCDEQPLVRCLPAPDHLSSGQGPLDLPPVVVVETVEQRGVVPAHVTERLQHRRVGPGPLDGTRGPAADPPAALHAECAGQVEDRGLADPGRTRHQQRAPSPRVRLVEPAPDVVAHGAPPHQPVRRALLGDPRRRPGHQGLAQPFDGRAGRRTQLAVQRLVEPLELAQRAADVALVREGVHDREVGLLVRGVVPEQLLPPSGQPEQVGVQDPDGLPGLLGPGLVRVVGQQRPAVPLQRGLGRLVGPFGQRHLAQATQLLHVDGHPGVRQQSDELVAEHDAARVDLGRGGRGEGPARVVGCLVQAWAGLLDEGVRPERVDHLLAVQPVVDGERQQLDQRCGAAAGPGVDRDRDAVDVDRESPEQKDAYVHGHARPR